MSKESMSVEFEVMVTPESPTIQSTLNELKQFVDMVDKSYVSMPITADNVRDAKSSLADFRKIKKAVTDKMRAVKDELLKPWNDLNEKVKETLSRLDHIEIEMNQGITAVVEAEKAAKHQAVVELFEDARSKLDPQVALVIKDYFEPRWENKSTSNSDILRDIQNLSDNANATLSAIKGNPHEAQLIGIFQQSWRYTEVATAIERFRLQDEQMAKIEEARRQEAALKAAAAAAAPAPNQPEEQLEPVHREPSINDAGAILTCTFEVCGTKEDIAKVVRYSIQAGAPLNRTSPIAIATLSQIAKLKEAR